MAQTWEGYEDRGVVTVPTNLQVAWCYRDEGVTWLLLNLATEPRWVRIDLHPPSSTGHAPGSWHLALVREGAPPEDLGDLDERRGGAHPPVAPTRHAGGRSPGCDPSAQHHHLQGGAPLAVAHPAR